MKKPVELAANQETPSSWTVRLLGKSKIAAGRKREPSSSPYPIPHRAVAESEFIEAKDKVMTARFERDIIDYALRKAGEEKVKSLLPDVARNQLVQRYESELRRIENETDHYKRTVDLYELESAREGLFRNFHEQMIEMDSKIGQLKPLKEPARWRTK